MAITFFSALINAMSGRLGDYTFGKIGGVSFIRSEPATRVNPSTARAVQIRSNFATVAGGYSGLSDDYVRLWDSYALGKKIKGGGRAAHRFLNCNLLNASHAELSVVSHPPHTPSTPKFPQHFCVTQLSSTVICLSWSSPADVNTFVTGHFRHHYGFCSVHPCYGLCPTVGVRRNWRFVGTARGDLLGVRHVHDFPVNTRLFYRLNSIDKWGRKSPFTHVLLLTTRA